MSRMLGVYVCEHPFHARLRPSEAIANTLVSRMGGHQMKIEHESTLFAASQGAPKAHMFVATFRVNAPIIQAIWHHPSCRRRGRTGTI